MPRLIPQFMPNGPLNLPKTAREKLAELMAQPIVNYDPLAGAPQATRNALPELTPNPWTMGDLANIAIDFSPIVGDIKAVGDAKQQFETGHPWLGGLSALSAVPGIGDIAALMKGGAALASLGIVAGRKAATANLNKLDEAVKMAERGLGRDEIYKSTGWWKGVDDKWRFEIPDDAASLSKVKFDEAADSAKKYFRNRSKIDDAIMELEHKSGYGEFPDKLTKSEKHKLAELIKTRGAATKGTRMVGHSELEKAYPELNQDISFNEKLPLGSSQRSFGSQKAGGRRGASRKETLPRAAGRMYPR